MGGEHPAQMMGPATRFQANDTSRELGRKGDQRFALDAPSQNNRACHIEPDEAANILSKIDAENRYIHDDPLPQNPTSLQRRKEGRAIP